MARANLCKNSITQYTAIETLKILGKHTEDMVEKLRERRDYSYNRLKKLERISCNYLDGAFYHDCSRKHLPLGR
ncbi:MAG: hypothetical protein KGD63_09215 [Candidatus Lokiarchaeota archaeon]|nr:hypothetical protein [Candidatus Lokiarchaeota archaeon]